MTAYSFLSTYPPTRCGLATFTEALATAMVRDGEPDARIVRMMDELAGPATPAIRTRSRVVAELSSVGSADDAEIRAAARALSSADVAVVQHEYGIFGGVDGDDVIRVMELLTVPAIVVLHTVLDTPTQGQRSVLERVCELAGAVVVMTHAARQRLLHSHAVDENSVRVIPHGVASWSAPTVHADSGRRTVLTWGLIGPGKGIEHGIRAMAGLSDLDAPVHYVVSGQTHPKVLAHSGESYRDGLRALVAELGLGGRVTLEGEYLDAAQLASRVGSADVVLLPYDSRVQVTSGVLVEALAAGKPVVATGFPHAVELLLPGTGVVVGHEDPAAIASGLRRVLTGTTNGHRTRGSGATTHTGWAEVGLRYRELASLIATSRVDLSA